MDYQALFNLIGNGLIVWAALVGVASVIVHSQVAWWDSPMGRHLMIYMSVIAAVLVLSCVRVFFGDSQWFQLVRMIVFIGVPLAMTQRLALQLRARRKPKGPSADTEPVPGPLDPQRPE